MKHTITTKTLVAAMVATQALQGLSSASYLSWFDLDQHDAPSLLSWIRGTIVTEVKELAYSYDIDENDVDVYDDTPSVKPNNINGFLFKKSTNSSSSTNINTSDEDKQNAKERARLAPIPFPRVPTRAARAGDVDVYDDTYVRGDDYTNFLRLRPMKKNDNTVKTQIATKTTTTKTTQSTLTQTPNQDLASYQPTTTSSNNDDNTTLDDLTFSPLLTLSGFDFDPVSGMTHYTTGNLASTGGQVVVIRSNLYTGTAMIMQRTFSSDEFIEEYPEYDISEVEDGIIETFIDDTAVIYTNDVGQNMAIYQMRGVSVIVLLSKNSESNWTMSMIMIDDEDETFRADIIKLIDSLSTSGEDIIPSSDGLKNQL